MAFLLLFPVENFVLAQYKQHFLQEKGAKGLRISRENREFVKPRWQRQLQRNVAFSTVDSKDSLFFDRPLK